MGVLRSYKKGLQLTVNMLWTVIRPAITAVESVQMFDVTVKTLLGELSSILLQTKVSEHSEPEPIGVRHARAI